VVRFMLRPISFHHALDYGYMNHCSYGRVANEQKTAAFAGN